MRVVELVLASQGETPTFSRGECENLLWPLINEPGIKKPSIDSKYLSVLEEKALSKKDTIEVIENTGQKRHADLPIDFFVNLLKALEKTGEIIFIPKSELSFYKRQKMDAEEKGSCIRIEGQLYFLKQKITDALPESIRNN